VDTGSASLDLLLEMQLQAALWGLVVLESGIQGLEWYRSLVELSVDGLMELKQSCSELTTLRTWSDFEPEAIVP
jgi:hypothetical protein